MSGDDLARGFRVIGALECKYYQLNTGNGVESHGMKRMMDTHGTNNS